MHSLTFVQQSFVLPAVSIVAEAYRAALQSARSTWHKLVRLAILDWVLAMLVVVAQDPAASNDDASGLLRRVARMLLEDARTLHDGAEVIS